MANVTIETPYASAMDFVTETLTPWTSEYDAQRIASYNLYDDVYRNTPDTTKMMLRGSDEKPIFVPTARKLVNTVARYIGKDWGFSVEAGVGSDTEQTAATDAFGQLFERERLLSKFVSGKKAWLRRGDWVWYISADPAKAPGTRLSINCIHPGTYFPITHENNLDRVTGARIIEETVLDDGRTVGLKVQTWLKPTDPNHPGGEGVLYESLILEPKDWNSPKRRILRTLSPAVLLPITQLPLYHIKFESEDDDPYGHSILAGLETLVAGINQTISDEDLALAMAGLGMYTTDSGRPVDSNGNPAAGWVLGPQMVVERGENTTFERLDGISSVEPSQTHAAYLEKQAQSIYGVSDVALGTVGTVASGISLALQMAPLMDAADEADLAINGVLNQMFFDLKQWFQVYEGINLGEASVKSFTDPGARIPFDRAAGIDELIKLQTAGVITVEFMISELQDKYGYEFPANMLQKLEAEQVKKAALLDPYATRAAGELTATPVDDPNVVDAQIVG